MNIYLDITLGWAVALVVNCMIGDLAMRKLQPDDPDVIRVCELSTGRKSCREIASELGMSYGKVYLRLRAGGGKMLPRGRLETPPGKVSIIQLAERVHRSPRIVKRMLLELGVSPQRKFHRWVIPESMVEKIKKKIQKRYLLESPDWRKAGVEEWEMGWLGGILDGEGCIQGSAVSSFIRVVTTTPVIEEKFASIARRLGIAVRLTKRSPKDKRWNAAWEIDVRGYRGQWKLLKVVQPFLVLKRRDADLVLQMCELKAAGVGGWKAPKKRKELVNLSNKLKKCQKDLNRGVRSKSEKSTW